MSNQTVNNENRFNRSKTIQNKQTSTTERVKVNSLLQRVVNGQAGVVLEELF